MLEKLHKYEEAAEIHQLEGRTLEAIRLFLTDENNQAAIQRGNSCILQGLWEHLSFGMKRFNKPEEVARLLALASKIKIVKSSLEAAAVDEVRNASIFFLLGSLLRYILHDVADHV